MNLEDNNQTGYSKTVKRKVNLKNVSKELNAAFCDMSGQLKKANLNALQNKLEDNTKRNYHGSTARRQNFGN